MTVFMSTSARGPPIIPGTDPERDEEAPEMSRMKDLTGPAASTPLPLGVQRRYRWYTEAVFGSAEPDVAR
jgi:hypothetical protein